MTDPGPPPPPRRCSPAPIAKPRLRHRLLVDFVSGALDRVVLSPGSLDIPVT